LSDAVKYFVLDDNPMPESWRLRVPKIRMFEFVDRKFYYRVSQELVLIMDLPDRKQPTECPVRMILDAMKRMNKEHLYFSACIIATYAYWYHSHPGPNEISRYTMNPEAPNE
jgi:hypothetical protein